MVTLLLAALAFAAPCDDGVDAATLTTRAVAAEQAWADMDSEAFVEQARALGAEVRCVSDALYPDQVAAWFRVQGLLHYYEADHDLALEDLRAARALDPDWTLAPDLAGADHPLRELMHEARKTSAATTPLVPAGEGWLRIDGERGLQVPVDRAYLFQRFDSKGQVQETYRVGAGHQPFAYGARRTVLDVLDAPEFGRYRLHQRNGRIVSGLGIGGLLVGSGLVISTFSFPFMGPSTPSVAGVTLMVLGGGAMVVGLPMQLVPATRERRVLGELGADPGLGSATVGWAMYAVSVPAVPLFGLGTLPYIGALAGAAQQSKANRVAAEGLRTGALPARRPRVAVVPVVRERCAGLQLSVTRW